MTEKSCDAIVVLGASVTEAGLPDAEGMRRVEAAHRLYAAGVSEAIVMTGNRTFYRDPVATSEAKAMKRYAIELGVPPVAIETENQGLDTIGNAYFTKRTVTDARGWRKLDIVTTDKHVPRSVAVFKHVMGPDYTVRGVSSGVFEARKIQHLQEAVGRLLSWAVLGGTTPGDDEAIGRRLFDLVPGYTDARSSQIMGNYLRRFAGFERRVSTTTTTV